MIETRFKKTEVGEIPEEWEVKTLGIVGEPKMCKRIMKFQTKELGDVPFYKIGTFGNAADAFISKELFEDYKSKFSFPRKGEILISAAGTIGRAIIYNGEDSYYQDSNIVWIENNEKIILNKFLFNLYQVIEWDTNTGTIPRLYNDNLKRTLIQCPPLAEQQRIATALSDIDTLLSTLTKKIEKKKLIKQGAMQQLLTGEKRLAGFTGPWEEKRLEEVCCNSAYGVAAEAIPYNGIDKYIRITDISDENGRFIPSPLTSPSFYDNHYVVQENDLLIARTGASVGKTYLYVKQDGRLIFAGFLMRINITNAHSKYVFYQTQTESYKKWINSESMRSGQPGLNMQQLLSYIVAFPPSLAEQSAIATILSDMDKEIEALEAKRTKYTQVKQGMMQQLLTGKIRLVD